jgi:hypothetical protein
MRLLTPRCTRRYGVAGISVLLGLVVGLAVVHAAFDSDSADSTHNSCYFSGYTSYNTDGPQYSYSQTFHDACASYSYLTVYECDPSCGDPVAESGWIPGESFPVYNDTTVPVPPNVYGYHQISKPSNSYSTTLETHAN